MNKMLQYTHALLYQYIGEYNVKQVQQHFMGVGANYHNFVLFCVQVYICSFMVPKF